MTEKRFKIEGIEEELYPMPVYYDRDKELTYDEVCELLNELYEDNMMLAGTVAYYKLLFESLEQEAKRISQIR